MYHFQIRMYSVIKTIKVLNTYTVALQKNTQPLAITTVLSYLISPLLLLSTHLCEFVNFIHFVKSNSPTKCDTILLAWSNLWWTTIYTAMCADFTVFKLICSGNYTCVSYEWAPQKKKWNGTTKNKWIHLFILLEFSWAHAEYLLDLFLKCRPALFHLLCHGNMVSCHDYITSEHSHARYNCRILFKKLKHILSTGAICGHSFLLQKNEKTGDFRTALKEEASYHSCSMLK